MAGWRVSLYLPSNFVKRRRFAKHTTQTIKLMTPYVSRHNFQTQPQQNKPKTPDCKHYMNAQLSWEVITYKPQFWKRELTVGDTTALDLIWSSWWFHVHDKPLLGFGFTRSRRENLGFWVCLLWLSLIVFCVSSY